MTSELLSKLQDPEYRRQFVAAHLSVGIALQVRALAALRKIGMEQLAKTSSIPERELHALTIPGMVKPDVEVLCRLAHAFGCGLSVRFVPFSELAHERIDFDCLPAIKSFDEETVDN